MMTSVIPIDYGALLNEARAAYHDLSLGRQARVYVDQNGERVEYTAANAGRLSAYITELERKLGLGSVVGPLTVMF